MAELLDLPSDEELGRGLRSLLGTLVAEIDRVQRFTPTPDGVNNLPYALRSYIRDIETNCDPAGDVAKLTLTMDQNRLLLAKVDRLRTWIEKLAEDAEFVMAKRSRGHSLLGADGIAKQAREILDA